MLGYDVVENIFGNETVDALKFKGVEGDLLGCSGVEFDDDHRLKRKILMISYNFTYQYAKRKFIYT